MKRLIILMFVLSAPCWAKVSGQVVTFGSLLTEMTDLSALARFPQPAFTSLQASSYNRASVSPDKPGWFADSDGTGYLREEETRTGKEYVIMEHEGPGCLTRIWTPFFYYDFNNRKGPDIRIYLDGSTKPLFNECFIDLVTGKGSVKPPFAGYTARAGDLLLPVPFAKSVRITLSERPFYYIVNFRSYEPGTKVKTLTSRELEKSKTSVESAARVLAGAQSNKALTYDYHQVKPEEVYARELPSGANAINLISIKLDPDNLPSALRSTILELTFDGKRTVWCPLGDFFCSPDKINPFRTFHREVLADGTLVCRYVMPYAKTATIKFINEGANPVGVAVNVQTTAWQWDSRSMHFHAAWNPVGTLPGDTFTDMNFIDIRGKGVLAGDALTVLSPGHGWWGEGDEKIYISQQDIDRKFPSHFGTGTEDYYGWAGGVVPTGRDTFSIPIGANVCNGNEADPRGYNICTRNRILDAIPFTNRLRFDMEASPGTDIRESWNLLDYSLVSFWYAVPCSESNIAPNPAAAKNGLVTLDQLDAHQEFLRNNLVRIAPEAKYPVKTLTAQPGQFFVFPFRLKAGEKDLPEIDFNYELSVDTKAVRPGLNQASESNVPDQQRIICFNTTGISSMGFPFDKIVSVPAGATQDFWIGFDLDGIPPGAVNLKIIISCEGQSQVIPYRIEVKGPVMADHGFGEGKTLARLAWLNSTIGIDQYITRKYIPVRVEGNRIVVLGRQLILGKDGLPADIQTFFTPSNQSLTTKGEPVINSPFRLVIVKDDGSQSVLKPGELNIYPALESEVTWEGVSRSPEFEVRLMGKMDFDGFVDYRIRVIPLQNINVRDIRLEIPFNDKKSEYMMGLNHEGGLRPDDWKWKWDPSKNQDMVWLGAVNGGMRIKLKSYNYRRPLINIYYSFGPLLMPPSWWNEGKGGININRKKADVLLTAYSGERSVKQGQILDFDFELLITPFRTIDKSVQFGDRYYHGGGTNTAVKIDNARAARANIINIHHAEDLYPFINYPYLDENVQELRQLVDRAHQAGMRMKFYYTTRELTKNLPEFKAFYSLNGEIIFPGPGENAKTLINPNGPNEWLKTNLKGGKYIPAWYNLVNEGKFKGETDLSVITTPDSRLNNFYVAGLDWMVRNIGIDGVYIDDCALDRFTLMRARKVIDRNRPEGRIDLHSWNHFNEWAGYASCLNLYMDLLPFVDQIWIGEGRDYNRMPDHWLVEVSGIPFGIPGQMLEGGGNPWRGMVYGITNRAGWTANPPGPVWAFWDEYQIMAKEFIGYWDPACPVKSSNPLIRVSVFKGFGSSIIAIANWSKEDQPANLTVNLRGLGVDPAKATIRIPPINGFQEQSDKVVPETLKIPGGKGYLIVISN